VNGRWRAALALVVLALTVGCLGSVGPDRSMETVDLTIATPQESTTSDRQFEPRTVRFLGPGSGGSAVIGENGSGLVVDAGADRNATAVRGALSRAGITAYDLWITGFNRTRLGGGPALLAHRPPANIGFSGLTANTSGYHRFLRAVVDAERQYRLYRSTAPFSYSTAGGTVQVVAPPPEYLADGAPAHNEVALAYTANGQRVLWVGDPGTHEERWLLNDSDADLGAAVLVLAAGARPSAELLDAVAPETVVVQGRTGANRTAERFTARPATVYRPAIEGPLTLRLHENRTVIGTDTPTPLPTAMPQSTNTTAAGTETTRGTGSR
jgi:beta-lactamase superfamily II metal-dependent hydrolase